MGYVIVGAVSFIAGTLVGIVVISMCVACKAAEEQQQSDEDMCHGCFGASFGDCDRCPKKGGESNDKVF